MAESNAIFGANGVFSSIENFFGTSKNPTETTNVVQTIPSFLSRSYFGIPVWVFIILGIIGLVGLYMVVA